MKKRKTIKRTQFAIRNDDLIEKLIRRWKGLMKRKCNGGIVKAESTGTF
jgi:hypothetical protein